MYSQFNLDLLTPVKSEQQFAMKMPPAEGICNQSHLNSWRPDLEVITMASKKHKLPFILNILMIQDKLSSAAKQLLIDNTSFKDKSLGKER